MTDSDRADDSDLSTAPEYEQLGEAGNPLSDEAKEVPSTGAEDAAMDHTPDEYASDDSAENPPLPDWGPTDGEHGVDGSEPVQ